MALFYDTKKEGSPAPASSSQKGGGLFYDYPNVTPTAPVAPAGNQHVITNAVTNFFGLGNPTAPPPSPLKAGSLPIPAIAMPGATSIGKQSPNSIPYSAIPDYSRDKAVADVPWYKQPGKIAANVIVDTVNDTAKRAVDLFSKSNPDLKGNEKTVDKTAKAFSLGLGIVNSVFSPISAVLQGAEKIPGVGIVAHGLNKVFQGAGELGTFFGDKLTDKLPVTDKTKKALRPVIDEAFALLGQVGLGKVAHEAAGPKLDKLQIELQKHIDNDLIAQKAKIEAPKPAEAPIATGPKTIPVKEINNLVDNSLAKNETGVREKSLKYFEENPEEITKEPIKLREVDGKVTIEDGRHRLQAANELGITDLKVEDVTPQYTGKQSALMGTGETKTRGLSAGVEEQAIANKLVADLGDLPEYKSMDIANQAKQAKAIIDADYARAKRIAFGEENAPQGIHPESVFTGVELRAIAEGDVETLRRLANSSLTSEATTMGQRIRLLGERNSESPVEAIKSVEIARREAAQKRGDIVKQRKSIAREIDKEIRKEPIKKETWADFIKSIQC